CRRAARLLPCWGRQELPACHRPPTSELARSSRAPRRGSAWPAAKERQLPFVPRGPHAPSPDIRNRLLQAPQFFPASFPASDKDRRDEPGFPLHCARAPLQCAPRPCRVLAPMLRVRRESPALPEAARKYCGRRPPPERKTPTPEKLPRPSRASLAPQSQATPRCVSPKAAH